VFRDLPHNWKFAVLLPAITFTIISLMSLMAGMAASETLNSPDPHAYQDWCGEEFIPGSWGSMGMAPFFNATVTYAVYGPGHFGLAFPEETDPSGGVDYVYAYQINSAGGNYDSINFFSVGLDGDETVRNIGSFGDGVEPSTHAFQGTSVVWRFAAPTLAPGNSTAILLFTSPASPEFHSATLQGAGGTYPTMTSLPHNLPSPKEAPEPATLILFVGATAVLCVFRPVRRRLK